MPKEEDEIKNIKDNTTNLIRVYECPSFYVDSVDIRASSSTIQLSSGIIRMAFLEQLMQKKEGFVRASVSMDFEVAADLLKRLQHLLRGHKPGAD